MSSYSESILIHSIIYGDWNSFVFTTVISELLHNNTSPHSTKKQCEVIEHQSRMCKVDICGSNLNIDDDVLYSSIISKPSKESAR